MQRHYLWEMDGRVWIEPARVDSKAIEHAQKTGVATPIPSEWLDDLVRKMICTERPM